MGVGRHPRRRASDPLAARSAASLGTALPDRDAVLLIEKSRPPRPPAIQRRSLWEQPSPAPPDDLAVDAAGAVLALGQGVRRAGAGRRSASAWPGAWAARWARWRSTPAAPMRQARRDGAGPSSRWTGGRARSAGARRAAPSLNSSSRAGGRRPGQRSRNRDARRSGPQPRGAPLGARRGWRAARRRTGDRRPGHRLGPRLGAAGVDLRRRDRPLAPGERPRLRGHRRPVRRARLPHGRSALRRRGGHRAGGVEARPGRRGRGNLAVRAEAELLFAETWRGRLLALDPADGALRWEQSLGQVQGLVADGTQLYLRLNVGAAARAVERRGAGPPDRAARLGAGSTEECPRT